MWDFPGRKTFLQWVRDQWRFSLPTGLLSFLGLTKLVQQSINSKVLNGILGSAWYPFAAQAINGAIILWFVLYMALRLNRPVFDSHASVRPQFVEFWKQWKLFWLTFLVFYAIRCIVYFNGSPNTVAFVATTGGFFWWELTGNVLTVLLGVQLFRAYLVLFWPERITDEALAHNSDQSQTLLSLIGIVAGVFLGLAAVTIAYASKVNIFDFHTTHPAILETNAKTLDVVANGLFALGLCLLTGRLEGRMLGIPFSLIAALYVYALIQIALVVVATQTAAEASLILVAAALKWLLFFLVAWLIETRTMEYYLMRGKATFPSIIEDWKAFAGEQEPQAAVPLSLETPVLGAEA